MEQSVNVFSFVFMISFVNWIFFKGTSAPQVIGYRNNGYSEKSDIWSIGCVILQMINKSNTIWDDNFECFELMMITIPITPKFPNYINEDLKSFLNCCFEIEEDERPTAFELMKHTFINKKQKKNSVVLMRLRVLEKKYVVK